LPKSNPYYSGPKSDHFDGTRFFNPEGMTPHGLKELVKWKLEPVAKWPSRAENPRAPAEPPKRVDGGDIRVTAIGHATMLIQTAGLNILTDPVWSERASPLSFAGPKRKRAAGISFEALPDIDLVLLSHNHYDHLDLSTLKRIHKRHGAKVITPLGNDQIIHSKVSDMAIATGDWNDVVEHGPLRIHFERCHHWSARGVFDRSMALWAGFTIETPERRIFHIGDTGFDHGRPYELAKSRHGGFDLAILPIGAYEPRWFMKDQHQNPDEAIRGFEILDAAHGIGHHWGTFQLTNESMQDPVQKLTEAMEERGILAHRFRALEPGEHWDLAEVEPDSESPGATKSAPAA
jgi:L-ascorbate metabolism protein UlaG (beta-lactamase superfamily)